MNKQDRERTYVTLSSCDSYVRANLSEISYESIPEEHKSFLQMGLIPTNWKYKNMTKPQSDENSTHVIIGSRNEPLLT